MTLVEAKHDRFSSIRPQAAQAATASQSEYCERAAIIVMALDEERSKRLLSSLSEDEVRRLGGAMARMGRTDM